MSDQATGADHLGGTESYRASRARSYFSQPGFERMLELVWKRYTSLEEAKGHAVIRGATAGECDAVNAFFGWYERPGADIRISLAEFDLELKRSAFPFTIAELHDILVGSPLLTKSDQKLLAEKEWQSLFDRVEYAQQGVQLTQAVLDWLVGMKVGAAGGYRTLRELWRTSAETAERELANAVRAWNLLLTGEAVGMVGDLAQAGIRLPVLAALVTGNPHALDRNVAAGRLLFQALRSFTQDTLSLGEADVAGSSEMMNVTSGIDSLVAREIYRRAGILDDDISSSVHICNPRGGTKRWPYVMTLRQVEAKHHTLLPVNNIYVVENPAVFSTLADVADKIVFAGAAESQDRIGSLLLCTSGPASAAALRLLDRYTEEDMIHGSLYYSGDFDIKGIEIGNVLALRYATRFVPWYFDSDSYRKRSLEVGRGYVLFSDEERVRLGKTQAVWDKSLCETMGISGIKLFQEQLIVQLAQEWKQAVEE